MRLATGLKWLGEKDVLVGIPQETNADHGGISNAELLFIHTNGSPASGIPARPTIQPAVQNPEVRTRIQNMFGQAMTMALMGNVSGAEMTYNRIGQLGANEAKKMFGAVGPPLKPSTVAAKGSSATLIDTGALRNAITFVVRSK